MFGTFTDKKIIVNAKHFSKSTENNPKSENAFWLFAIPLCPHLLYSFMQTQILTTPPRPLPPPLSPTLSPPSWPPPPPPHHL
jgi:hypothetical protein